MYGYSRPKDFLVGALVGGTIATLTVLLMTTKKGKQLRKQVADFCGEVQENVSEAFSDSKEQLEDAAEHVGKKVAHKVKSEHSHKDSK